MQFIDGVWIKGRGELLQSNNPATGEILWQHNAADATQVADAVEAAKRVQHAWSATAFEQRLEIAKRFSALVEARAGELSELIARETGKVMWDAKGEVAATIGKVKFAEAAYLERSFSKVSANPTIQGVASALRHRAHGVMAVYGPYNFPAHLPNGHITPALLAGNTVVFKPSEQTPAVGEWMVKCWSEAGLPAGVLNLVQGAREVGIALAASEIDGVLFTGSSATGKALHAQFAGRPEVLLALEMGGNNPLIVHEIGTDELTIKAAVREIILSAFIGSGQRCTCARRLIITEGAWRKPLIEVLVKSVAALKIGSFDETPEPFMGPLISMREAKRLLGTQDILKGLGGIVLHPLRLLREGLPFLSPCVIDVTAVADLPDEEYFGPLLQIVQVAGIEQAWAVANHTQFGLSAGIFSSSRDIYEQGLNRLHAGLINWNKQTTGASGSAPFGGVGASGNHRPAGYYAADYCAYPIASVESERLVYPESIESGLEIIL